MGPQKCDKIGPKFGPKLAQKRCQRERKDGFAIPFTFKCRVEVEPTPCQVRGRLRKKGAAIMKAVTNRRDGCSLGASKWDRRRNSTLHFVALISVARIRTLKQARENETNPYYSELVHERTDELVAVPLAPAGIGC